MLMDMRFFYTFFPTFGGETFVFFCLSPSGECYAFGSRCLKCFVFQNRLNRAMYGLRQSPRLRQDHCASVMERLGFRRCKSDSNLDVTCHGRCMFWRMWTISSLLET